MKNILRFSFLVAALCLAIPSFSQKVRLLDGNLSALNGQTKLNLIFDYSKMGVGKFDNESDYIAKKKTDLDEKEPGRGKTWEAAWKADRKNRYEPQFRELFMKNSDMKVGEFPDAAYTMIFKTTYTEPGYNIYVSRKNASINTEIWIVKTGNNSSPLAKMEINKIQGRTFWGSDYETGQRIEEAYAKAGKLLGKFFGKEIK